MASLEVGAYEPKDLVASHTAYEKAREVRDRLKQQVLQALQFVRDHGLDPNDLSDERAVHLARAKAESDRAQAAALDAWEALKAVREAAIRELVAAGPPNDTAREKARTHMQLQTLEDSDLWRAWSELRAVATYDASSRLRRGRKVEHTLADDAEDYLSKCAESVGTDKEMPEPASLAAMDRAIGCGKGRMSRRLGGNPDEFTAPGHPRLAAWLGRIGVTTEPAPRTRATRGTVAQRRTMSPK